MPRNVLPIIESLFAHDGALREPVEFQWRLIYRFRRPFLLVPASWRDAQAGLKIYSAQRPRAKVWRTLVPFLFKTPAARLFPHLRYRADAASEIMQFMAQQAATPANRLMTPAIMFSGTDYKSRVTLLLCNEQRQPVRVIKVGLNAAWRKVTEQEASLMEQLPPNLPGCMRLTGRLATPRLSGFAMDFAPGNSPPDDANMDGLLQAWLNPVPPVPLESLELWSDLAAKVTATDLATWDVLQEALKGKTVRTTLFHGDFSPWNICTTGPQNIQAYDWERSHLQGIPGWDWFHFIIQTSILARGHSAARAAAEVEQLIHSPRFKKYAAAAEITDIIQPLMLAYLLHYLWTFKPMEGGQVTRELFDLLFENWQTRPGPMAVAAPVPESSGLLAAARSQLQSAAGMWRNLFWEPRLNADASPATGKSLKIQWPVLLLAGLLLAAVAGIQFVSAANLLFLPFYLGLSAMVTWKVGRRWGLLTAFLAAGAGTSVVAVSHPNYRPVVFWLWNGVMRFLVLQLSVVFLDRLHRRADFFQRRSGSEDPPVKIADAWAVVIAGGGLLAGVAGLDWLFAPQMTFTLLYLVPTMMITLGLNLRWGLVASVLAAFTATLIELLTDTNCSAEIAGWNFMMRLAVFLTVLLLLDRIRRGNFLFLRRKTNTV